MDNPPFDYLLACSGTSLRDFELNRLNQSANLRKQILAIRDELLQAEAEAILARWLMKHREKILNAAGVQILQGSFEFTRPRTELPALPAAPRPARASALRKNRSGKDKENVA